eukprot:6196796-Pleurochrysis_carterae.AAC.2
MEQRVVAQSARRQRACGVCVLHVRSACARASRTAQQLAAACSAPRLAWRSSSPRFRSPLLRRSACFYPYPGQGCVHTERW